jgi:Flp pilus assembly protein TadD
MRFGLACALACACAQAQKAPPARGAFLELQSEHYVVVTDLAEPAARAAIARMEDVRAALLEGSWRGDAPSREKLRVVQLASSAGLRQFANPGMSAFYQPVDLFGEPFLILTVEEGEAGDVVLKHELAHAQHGSFLPRSPRWFFEGLACYLETLRYDAAGGHYVIGGPSEERLEYLLAHPDVDYGRVLAMPTRDAVLLGGREGYEFQSAAWLLVFYLANEYRSELDGYIGRLARREEAQAAFAAAFPGLDAAELAKQAARYRASLAEGKERIRLREVRLPSAKADAQVRTVPAADVQAMRAQLFFLSPGLPRVRAHLAQARATAEAALQADPSQPLALAVLLALPEGASPPPPLERIRAAAADRPGDFRSQMLLAFVVGPERPEERRAALAKAAQLAPGNSTVLNALAWHELTHGRASEAVAIAEKAVSLAPGRAAVLDTLATALAKSSRCAEAASVEERAVELSAEHASGELRRRLLARLDAMRAGCAALPLEDE